MSDKEIIKALKLKKESLERLLNETKWNKDNIKSMYNICDMIKDIKITIKNVQRLKMEKFIYEKSEYYAYLENLK